MVMIVILVFIFMVFVIIVKAASSRVFIELLKVAGEVVYGCFMIMIM